MAEVDGQSHRASNSSVRSSSSRSRQNPQQQLSTIEKSVTHLLVATKQLLETLTQWSRGTATEGEVSDVYVRLGYEFNIACRAFTAIGVETSDLGPVPDLLRNILEDTLSQEASQASLDKYLPKIRDIIINLLHGLKKKQQRLRQGKSTSSSSPSGGGSGARDASSGGVVAHNESKLPRQSSVASNASADSSLANQLDEFPTRMGSVRPQAQGVGGDVLMPDLPPRTTSAVSGGRQSPPRINLSPQNSMYKSTSRDTMVSDSGSSMSSNALQNIPVIVPYPEADTMPMTQPMQQDYASLTPEPPPAPPKQNDALSALQRGGDLERRASRRFSAYQIQKQLGTSMHGIAAIPPAQNSPIPNRGRDVQESLSAVRSRGSLRHSSMRSRNQGLAKEPSPARAHEFRRISEADESGDQPSSGAPPPSKSLSQDELPDSPHVKTPEDKLASYPFPETTSASDHIGATLVNGPMSEHFDLDTSYAAHSPQRGKSAPASHWVPRRADTQTPPPQYVPEGSPQAGKELTIFLQYKSKIKKFVLPDGGDLTIPRLQLAFIEKFAWNTQNNGVDLPEIYIQDPVSGVRHELEDLSDIKERSVLALNVEALDEVKRHIDDGLGGIRRIVEGIRTSVADQHSAIQRVSDRQQETAKEIASIAAAPPQPALSASPSFSANGERTLSTKDKAGQLNEVQSLRRDLAVVRQTYTSFVADMKASMAGIRSKADSVKTAAAVAASPAPVDSAGGRAYVDKGKKQLSDDSEKIVNRVDDLQDVVEDLRKDVVTRGVRPLPRQLELVSRDISTATADLKKLQHFLRSEKPLWTKIWERELQVVCDDRDLLTLQEELAVDLEDDLDKAAHTFALVEQATKQQSLHAEDDVGVAGGAGSKTSSAAQRSTSRTLPSSAADPHKAKDSVLGEVRALQPNHASRLEAIERAERARRRELDARSPGAFQAELGEFVEERRLRKTGGVEEVERVRKAREDAARKEMQERQAQRLREKAERENAAAAEAAAGSGDAGGGGAEIASGENGDAAARPNGVESGETSDVETPFFTDDGNDNDNEPPLPT